MHLLRTAYMQPISARSIQYLISQSQRVFPSTTAVHPFCLGLLEPKRPLLCPEFVIWLYNKLSVDVDKKKYIGTERITYATTRLQRRRFYLCE